jgi:hypothetical protein
MNDSHRLSSWRRLHFLTLGCLLAVHMEAVCGAKSLLMTVTIFQVVELQSWSELADENGLEDMQFVVPDRVPGQFVPQI